MGLTGKLIRHAQRLHMGAIFSRRRRSQTYVPFRPSNRPSYQSYQEYHRVLFGLDDHGSSAERGPLEVRNQWPADSITRGPSDVAWRQLHERIWEEPIVPPTLQPSLTTRGVENEIAHDVGSQSSCDHAPARISCGPSWNGASSLSTVVEEDEKCDEDGRSQTISQPFLPEGLTRRDVSMTNTLYAGRSVRADNLPLAFLRPGDSDKEVVDNEENRKLNARFEEMNNLQRKDRKSTRRVLHKTKSIKVVPTTLSNLEKPPRRSGSLWSRLRHAFRRQKHDPNHWDILNSQAQEPIEMPASPSRQNVGTLPSPIPSIIISPPSPPISRLPRRSLSTATIQITRPSSNDNGFLHPAIIPEHVMPDPAQRRQTLRLLRYRAYNDSASGLDPTPDPAGTDTDQRSPTDIRLRLLNKMALIRKLAEQLEEEARDVERLDNLLKNQW